MGYMICSEMWDWTKMDLVKPVDWSRFIEANLISKPTVTTETVKFAYG